MLKHLFKLIWNKKKQNALLITEMFISFIVMFAVFTMAVLAYQNFTHPRNFDHKNVWTISYTPPETITKNDSAAIFQEALRNTVLSMPQVESMAFCGNNSPYSMNSSTSDVSYAKHESVRSHVFNVEEDYAKVLGIKLKSGRWFTQSDAASSAREIVINEKIANEFFPNENPIGKKLGTDFTNQLQVIGVVPDMKTKGDYDEIDYGMYMPIDTGSRKWTSTMVLKVRPGTDAAFESKMFKTLSDAIGTSIEIQHLDQMLESKNKFLLVPMIIVGIVAGFLIINVALGLFGVLWYNINKRKSEIGLRRAVGASAKSISAQLVGEALVLSTISLLIGSFFAIQFPLLNVFDVASGSYIIALVFAVIFIYLLVIICAIYPGKQAAAIYPAVALHED